MRWQAARADVYKRQIVPGALGKDDRIFAGDLEVEMPEFEAEH